MAVEFPLVLYHCEFENIQWIYDQEVQEFNITHLQQLWANYAVKTHMLYDILQGLDSVSVPTGTGRKIALLDNSVALSHRGNKTFSETSHLGCLSN